MEMLDTLPFHQVPVRVWQLFRSVCVCVCMCVCMCRALIVQDGDVGHSTISPSSSTSVATIPECVCVCMYVCVYVSCSHSSRWRCWTLYHFTKFQYECGNYSGVCVCVYVCVCVCVVLS